MSYLNGNFIQKENERRELRNKKRDEFFAAFGVERLTDPLRIDADPATQQAKVMELIEKAITLHDENTSGLHALRTSLQSLSFGLPVLSIGIHNQLSLHDVTPEALQKINFNMNWAEWFDE